MTFRDAHLVPVNREFYAEVSLSNISGWVRQIFKGFVASPTPPAYIWTGGTFTWRNTPTAAEVLSSSASDTAAGTGARTILVSGVGPLFAPTSETVTLNGTSVVALVNQYIHINNVKVVTAGSGQTNAGNITVRIASAGATLNHIATGVTSSQNCIFMTCANQAYLTTNQVLGTNGAAAQITTFNQEMYNTTTGVITRDNVFHISTNGTSPFVLPQDIPLIVPEKSGFAWRTTAQSAGTPDITARVQGMFVDLTLAH